MALQRFTITHITGRAVMVGLVLVLFSWPMAAALDAFYGADSFLLELTHPGIGKVVLRLLFMGIQLVFILYINRILGKYRQQGGRLNEALQDAEMEKVMSKGILEAVGDAISMQDLDLKILYQNQAHKELMDCMRASGATRPIGTGTPSARAVTCPWHSRTARLTRMK